MYNPIFSKPKNIIFYSTIWLLLSLFQTSILYWFFHISFPLALLDSFIYNVFFGLLGRLIWPSVFYIKFDIYNYLNGLITIIILGFISIFCWYFFSYFILLNISLLFNDSVYKNFINDYKIFRMVQGSFYYLILIINFYFFIFLEEKRETQLIETKLKNTLKQAELDILKSQLNPHFIFNSLNSISSLTIIDPKKAQQMVVLLSNFLRYALKSTNSLVPFNEELQAIEQYLAIEKVRFEDRLQLFITKEKSLAKFTLPSLILQPLIENAIKFGLNENTELSTIKIDCKELENHIHIRIENNFDPNMMTKKGEGLGLKNVKNRLNLIYGHSNWIRKNIENNLFIIELTLPKK